MKISSEDIKNLIDQIREEPSVLLLGQNYLSSFNKSNPFLDASAHYWKSSDALSSVNQIWDFLQDKSKLNIDDFQKVREVYSDIPTQWWLRKILAMRWGIVYTTAVDGCLSQCVGPNFSMEAVPMTVKSFRREYIDKNSLHCCYLYGSFTGENEEFPPLNTERKSLRSLLSSIESRLSWIKDSIIPQYGVLVIDGWNSNKDWLHNVLRYFNGMPWHSIYLFGCTEEIEASEEYCNLEEDGIIVSDERSFASALDTLGYFDDLDEFEEQIQYSHQYTGDLVSVSIKGERGSIVPLMIPRSALNILPSQVVLIDDGLDGSKRPDKDILPEQYAQFVQQSNPPNWSLHNEAFGFHFNRNIDDELLNCVKTSLKKKSSFHRKTLILEGPSNSGKTEALIHLALTIHREMLCPVIYIYNSPSQTDFAESLKNFIKANLLNSQMVDGKFVDNVVIIWDGNEDANAIQQYTSLASKLIECNAQIIGTTYQHKNSFGTPKKNSRSIEYLSLSAELNTHELMLLDESLLQIDIALHDRYCEIRSKKAQNPNLLYILQQLSKYQYSAEWKNASAAIRQRFLCEVNRTEARFESILSRSNQNNHELCRDSAIKKQLERLLSFDNVKKEIAAAGFGAAWQLQLKAYMAQQGFNIDDPLQNEMSLSEKDDNLFRLRDDIHLINNILAVSGQFSVSLPLSLIYNCIRSKNGEFLSQESTCISNMLEGDSLIDYFRDSCGQILIRFRHPAEAEEYINQNLGTGESRRQEEINLLISIIKACNWDTEDSFDVIKLIRCFGPNSNGKYSESPENGHYTAYIDYLREVADCLDTYGNGPEAVLVAAHFRREKYADDLRPNGNKTDDEIISDKKELDRSQAALQNAIESYDRHDHAQYNRLLVELCANIVTSMPRSKNDGIFQINDFHNLESYFKDAVYSWTRDDTSFSTNALLDIWLNGFEKYRASFASDDTATANADYVKALANTLSYIDELLDLDALSRPNESNGGRLLEHIDMIYKLAKPEASKALIEKMESLNNDTFLYINARKCWITDNTRPRDASDFLGQVKHDLFFLPDDADKSDQLREELINLKKQATDCAYKAIAVLEEKPELTNKSRRCLFMLLRCKWLVWTNHLLLEEKQKSALTREQWEEINELCMHHNVSDSTPEYRPAVLLLQGIYNWIYGNPSEARSIFSRLRKLGDYSWFIERIGLCCPGNNKLRQFSVDIQPKESGKYTATLKKELPTTFNISNPSVSGRYGIHVSDRMLAYLFDDGHAHTVYNLQKPVVVWFNYNGPTLGMPED